MVFQEAEDMEETGKPQEGEGEEERGAKLRELEASIEAHPEDPSLHFDLGVLLWEKVGGGGGSALAAAAAEQFVIVAKLNPQNAAAFRYLGHYYSSGHEPQTQRALKCYQRAVSLHPEDSDSGESLCRLLHHLGMEALELASCNEASIKSPRAFWAFRRLGFVHLRNNSCSEAVRCLQQAIRGYPASVDLWEALALAYQRLGMFTAATKSYGRAIELEDTRIFSLVESGNIFLMLGSFRKGVEQFQRALEISPQNVSARYGLASGLFCLSKECMNLGAFKWGASLLEDAYKVANANIQIAGNVSCIWKLLGDIQITYAKCLPWMKDSQNVEFDVESFNASLLSWKGTCHLFAVSAKKSYQCAMHLAPWQANLYIDIAVTSEIIAFTSGNNGHDNLWKLSEKLALGALLLEGENHDFWVALGCLSDDNALKQHVLIRALQLDVSLAVAWAYLGKLYREVGENKMARQAFDCARSIDPSLALPWAGMSADSLPGEAAQDEAFESCLRAVQILPLADFQIGLAKLALQTGNLASTQVFGAIKQAVQRAPQNPESHNLNGLVCEARAEYQAAVSCYKLARCAINISSGNAPKSHFQDIAVNLARSLTKAGYAEEAVQECVKLKEEGILGADGMQIYALSLWELGNNSLALGVIRDLATVVSTMDQASAAASVSFICKLLYYIYGLDSAIMSIMKMPKGLLQSLKVSFVVSAIHAVDQSNRLESAVLNNHLSRSSHDDIEMEYLIALAKLIKHGSEYRLGFQSGINQLKKALHVHPNSILIRNLLGQLLLLSEECKDSHVPSRCCIINSAHHGTGMEGLKSGHEILGAATISCYAIGNKNPKFSFPTCGCQCMNGPATIKELQKYLHWEPWNHNTRYLLILNLLQKAREERFPRQLCFTLEQLIFVALSNELYSIESMSYQYQKFQLLLCASEISLQGGNLMDCIKYAENASSLLIPNNYLFFGHLLLCRAYAAEGNSMHLQEAYKKCVELKTDNHIGWICLKIMEAQYNLQTDSNILELSFKECAKKWKNTWNTWMAAFDLVLGLIYLWNQGFVCAEKSLAEACSLAGADSCLFMCHGVTCMELARQFSSTHFLSLAIRSLSSAHENSVTPIPIVFLLLAQAEGSLGSKEKWEKNLRQEWFSWSPESRPAELFFQMHLLARQAKVGLDSSFTIEFCQSPLKWVLRSIHTNPSCVRYWKAMHKLVE